MIDEKKLTIDEAIAHAREVAERNRKQYKNCPADRRDIAHQTCRECYKEHEQLAEWLEELRELRSMVRCNAFKDGYNKAIGDFVKEICKMIVQSENNGNYRFYAVEIKQAIADLAEQLKEKEK